MSGQGASEKIREFCNVEKFSIAFFYELERRGLGPLMLGAPGSAGLWSRTSRGGHGWPRSPRPKMPSSKPSAAARKRRSRARSRPHRLGMSRSSGSPRNAPLRRRTDCCGGSDAAAASDYSQPRTANDALAVTDGAVTIGYIIERDSAFFAFDADGVLIGEYATRTQAVRSIRWCGELVPPTGPRAPAGAAVDVGTCRRR